MGDRGRQLAHRHDAVGVRELQLRLAVSLLAFASFCLCCPQRCLCLYDRCHIGASAAITAEFSIGVKHWLAAGLHVHWSAAAARRAIYKVTKRFMGIESRPNN